LVVSRESGKVNVIPNTYDEAGGDITFGVPFELFPPYYHCDAQGWTVGIFDLAVRFADLDGNGM